MAAPILQSATVNAAGTQVTLRFDQALDGSFVPSASVFTLAPVKVISKVAISGSTVVLTVASAFAVGDDIRVSYTNPNSGNEQRLSLLARWYKRAVVSTSDIKLWTPTSVGEQPEIIMGLRPDGENRYLRDIRIVRDARFANNQRLALDIGNQRNLASGIGGDLTDAFETRGSMELIADSGQVLSVSMADVADKADPYFVFSNEATGYLTFFNALSTSSGSEAITLVLRDYVPGKSLRNAAGEEAASFANQATSVPVAEAPDVVINVIPTGVEGTGVKLSAKLTGGRYDTISYAWVATGGALDNAALAEPTWTRPGVASARDFGIDLRITVRGNGNNAAAATSDTANATRRLARVTPEPVILQAARAPTVVINAVPEGREGTSVKLSAKLTGGRYDALTYAWVAASGSLDDGALAEPTWTRPDVSAAGDYSIALVVTALGRGVNARQGTSQVAQRVTVSARVTDTPDTTAPAFVSATDTARTVVLAFDEALDTRSVPAAAAFAVTVDDEARSVTVAISGLTVILTLTTPIFAGEHIEVAYTKPAQKPLQDAAGNAVANFSTELSGGTPVLRSTRLIGRDIVLAYLGRLAYDAEANLFRAFGVKVDGQSVGIAHIFTHSDRVVLRLDNTPDGDDTISVSYDAMIGKIQDLDGHLAASFTDTPVANSGAGQNSLSGTTISGNVLTLEYTGADLKLDPPVQVGYYTVKVNSRVVAVTRVNMTATRIELTLARSVRAGEGVTVSYAAPLNNKPTDIYGWLIASFTDRVVVNAADDTTTPANTDTIELEGAVVFGTALFINFTEVLYVPRSTNIPHISAFDVTVNGVARTLDDTVTIVGASVLLQLSSAAASGQTVTVRYRAARSSTPIGPLDPIIGGAIQYLRTRDAQVADFFVFAENLTGDTTPPLLDAAIRTDDRIELHFDKPLDPRRVPDKSAFTLTGGTSPVVASVYLAAHIAHLTFTGTEPESIAYQPPAQNPLTGVNGVKVAKFTAELEAVTAVAPITVTPITLYRRRLTTAVADRLNDIPQPVELPAYHVRMLLEFQDPRNTWGADRIWTGEGTLNYDGAMWLGIGDLLGAGAINVTVDGRGTYTFVMTLVDSTVRAAALRDLGVLGVIVQWVQSTDGVAWGRVPIRVDGRLSASKVKRSTLEATVDLREFDRSVRLLWSHEHFIARGYTGARYLPELAESRDIKWPKVQ